MLPAIGPIAENQAESFNYRGRSFYASSCGQADQPSSLWPSWQCFSLAGLVVMPMFFDQPKGFQTEDLVAPEVYLDQQPVPWKPRPITTQSLNHSMQLSWAMTPIYAGYGGVLNLSCRRANRRT